MVHCQPFPISKIQDLLLKLEGFQWATSLDLNIGYCHIRLSPGSKTMCTIVMPWGSMNTNTSPWAIFQEYMGELMGDLEHVRAYIDDLFIVTKRSF